MQEAELKVTATEIIPARQVNAPKAPKKATPGSPEIIDRKDLNFQWKRESELVRGRFVNDETPGEAKAFAFRKFKQDPIRKYGPYKDQGIYEVPLYVAKHLNEDCKVPIYGHSKDEEGNSIEIITGYKKRCHFESLEFTVVGDEDSYLPEAVNRPQLRERYS